MGKMGLLRRIAWVFPIIFCSSLVHGSSAEFIPVDNYLIACGSSQNVSVQGQTFVPDSHEYSFLLESEGDVAVASSSSSVPYPIYQSLRVFTQPSSYEFDIRQKGRHWVRLYFHPLPYSCHDLFSASITVLTENFVLLNNFTFKDQKNQALVLSPSTPFNGLSEFALETVYRLNMGGPLLTPENDTLGRTWENDGNYLHVNSSAVNVSVDPATVKYPVGLTTETAPNWVYATAEAMANANVPNLNFNVTWVFSADPDFIYFVRLHFCDIVSKALNDLVFNVYINSNIVIASLDLSAKTGDLAIPYYKDFISNSTND
ncbi:hypothetical protein AAC387_Pa06g3223 [Persea americana]